LATRQMLPTHPAHTFTHLSTLAYESGQVPSVLTVHHLRSVRVGVMCVVRGLRFSRDLGFVGGGVYASHAGFGLSSRRCVFDCQGWGFEYRAVIPQANPNDGTTCVCCRNPSCMAPAVC
jgi:hypothetical protein